MSIFIPYYKRLLFFFVKLWVAIKKPFDPTFVDLKRKSE